MSDILDKRFLKAYEIACNSTEKLPPDIMLHFYAYYKRATQKNGFYSPEDEEDIRNGFKANAMLQVEDLSAPEAKSKYIEMVEKHIREV